MELYIKNKQGQLEEVSLINVFEKALNDAGFEMDNGSFQGEDHSWIGIIQNGIRECEILTNIQFKSNGNKVCGLNVYTTPIKTILDKDNSVKLV